MRTSDWSSAIVSWLGKFVPKRWRGHHRDRAVREELLHAVDQAVNEPELYDLWVARFNELHKLALNGNLQNSSLLEIKKILQA